jgi:hypothetical protein
MRGVFECCGCLRAGFSVKCEAFLHPAADRGLVESQNEKLRKRKNRVVEDTIQSYITTAYEDEGSSRGAARLTTCTGCWTGELVSHGGTYATISAGEKDGWSDQIDRQKETPTVAWL